MICNQQARELRLDGLQTAGMDSADGIGSDKQEEAQEKQMQVVRAEESKLYGLVPLLSAPIICGHISTESELIECALHANASNFPYFRYIVMTWIHESFLTY